MSIKIFIGTSGWIYPDWKGVFYPVDLPKSQWFEYYQTQFNIVEINATFYRFFKKETFIKWKENANSSFKYIIKVPRLITHRKYLKNCSSYIKKFCQLASLLENKLALILLQLPPQMPYDLKRLEKALEKFPDPTKVVVEFRHQKWLTPEVFNLLTRMQCIFCAADSPNTSLINWVTSPIAYIRLHGRRRWYNDKYSTHELKEIVKLIKEMTKSGAQEIYILFNNDYHSYACENAETLRKLLKISK